MVAGPDWQVRSKRGDCGSVAANIYFTECAESRSKALLDQARAILTNRHDIAQHFFTLGLTVEIIEESSQ